MNLRLISLVFAPFAFGTSAFVYVGLITPMSIDLGVGVPTVGQLQTVFAVACGIGGPILARLTTGFDRKRLLLIIMAILTVMNMASAIAPTFGLIAGIRFAGGLFAALTLPLATTLAVNMASEINRPQAIATVLAGYTLAFLVGMPLGSVLGDAYGWRAAFWLASGLSVLALLIIAVAAPKHVHVPQMGDENFGSALRGDNPIFMGITLLSFAATFATVSFLGPVITKATGLEGAAIGAVQVATGVGSLFGLPLGAWLARLPVKRALAMLLCTTAVTQLLFTILMVSDLGTFALPILLVAMTGGAGALFATSPIIQTNIAKSAGSAVTIAFALNGSMLYFGQGIGASLGGGVTAVSSLAWTGLAGTGAAALGLLLISRLGRELGRPARTSPK